MSQKTTVHTRHQTITTKYPLVKQKILCGQCDQVEATMKCIECTEFYCANCFAYFHIRGALKRHHCLNLSSKRPSPLRTNESIKLLVQSPLKDDVHRRSTLSLSLSQSTDYQDEKLSAVSDQLPQKPLRSILSRKLKPILPKAPTTNQRTNLPKISTNEKRPLKAIHQNSFRTKSESPSKRNPRDPANIAVQINIHHATSDLERNDLRLQRRESIETIISDEDWNDENLDQQRPVTHISMESNSQPNSPSLKRESRPSRPTSVKLCQQSLRSLLIRQSSDELQAILDFQLPAPVSITPTQVESQDSSNQDELQVAVRPAESNLSESSLVSKIVKKIPLLPIESREISSPVVSGYRYSPFNFTHAFDVSSPRDSVRSKEMENGGFFTDILSEEVILSTKPFSIMTDFSPTKDSRPPIEDPIFELDPIDSMQTEKIATDPLPSTATGNHPVQPASTSGDSRPLTAVSSVSLPISAGSSKSSDTNFDSSIPLSDKTRSSSTTSTITNDKDHPSIADHEPTARAVNRSHILLQSSLTPKKKVTVPKPSKKKKKKTQRTENLVSNSSKLRKLEFSVGVGVQWHEASVESMSSNKGILGDESDRMVSPITLTLSSTKDLAQHSFMFNVTDDNSRTMDPNHQEEKTLQKLSEDLASKLNVTKSDSNTIWTQYTWTILEDGQRRLDEIPCVKSTTE